MKPKRQEDSSCVFAYYFCRGTCHRRDTAGKERAPKSIRRRSGKRSFVKAVRTIRQENRQGRGKLPPCMPQSECGAGHTGYRTFLDALPDGSQDTGGAFRSRVQRPGVRGCSHEQRSKTSIPQRTDLAQVKRDRHTDRPRKARNTKASACGSLSVLRRSTGNDSPCQRVKCVHLNTTTTTRSFLI